MHSCVVHFCGMNGRRQSSCVLLDPRSQAGHKYPEMPRNAILQNAGKNDKPVIVKIGSLMVDFFGIYRRAQNIPDQTHYYH
jgi:hypothetical protein